MSYIVEEKGGFWDYVLTSLRNSLATRTFGSEVNDGKAVGDEIASVIAGNFSKISATVVVESFIKLSIEKGLPIVQFMKSLPQNYDQIASLALDKHSQTKTLQLLDTLNLSAHHGNQFLLQVREFIANQLYNTNQELQKLGIPLEKSAEDILNTMVDDTNYAKNLFNALGHFANLSEVIRMVVQIVDLDTKNIDTLNTYMMNWITQVSQIPIGKSNGIANVISGDAKSFLDKVPVMSGKHLVAIAARGVFMGILTDMVYKVSYGAGEWFFTDGFKLLGYKQPLYEMEGFAKWSDKFYKTIFQDIEGTELNAVIAFNTMILGNFINEANQSVIDSDTVALLGDDDYKNVDFKKALANYKKLYELVSGQNDVHSVNDAQSMIEHMEKSYPIFKDLRGEKLLILLDNEPNQAVLEQAKQEDSNGVAVRYALKQLNPFVLLSDKVDYQQHNHNGELDLYSSTNPNGMTEIYIQKRAEMLLAWLKNQPETLHSDFMDIAQDIHLQSTMRDYSAGNNGIKKEVSQVIFGSDNSERDKQLNGGLKDDFIFGGGGNDILRGDSGKDYLEGNLGNDILRGGGQNDIMNGGEGEDWYYISHQDTIIDSDMKGRVIFDKGIRKDIQAQSFAKMGEGLWRSVNSKGEFEGEMIATRQDQNLKIQTMEHSVTIENFFQSKNRQDDSWQGLGIDLEEVDISQLLNKPTNYGDEHRLLRFTHDYTHNVYTELATALQHERERLIHAKKYAGSLKDDMMFNTQNGSAIAFLGEGNDWAYGGYGYDWIYGEAGNDMLFGSALAALIARPKDYGQEGKEKGVPSQLLDSDYLVGGAGSDLIFGLDGNDTIYTDEDGNNNTIAGHLVATNKVASALRGDLAAGGQGNDLIYGSLARDLLTGGAGGDTIHGGAGNDVLIGDGELFPDIRRGIQASAQEINIGKNGNRVTEGTISRVQHLPFDSQVDDMTSSRHKINQNAWDFKVENGQYTYESVIPKRLNEHRVKQGGDIDLLYGGEGDDVLIGQDGNDILNGGAGNDVLWGDDYINSESFKNQENNNNDTLIAGKGQDYLYGGFGYDSYVLEKADLTSAKHDTKYIEDTDNQGIIFMNGVALDSVEWQADENAPTSHWTNAEKDWDLRLNGSDLLFTSPNKTAFVADVLIKNFQNQAFGLNLFEENTLDSLNRQSDSDSDEAPQYNTYTSPHYTNQENEYAIPLV